MACQAPLLDLTRPSPTRVCVARPTPPEPSAAGRCRAEQKATAAWFCRTAANNQMQNENERGKTGHKKINQQLNSNQNLGGREEGRASFPIESLERGLTNPSQSLTLGEEGEERKERKKEGATGTS